jgi:mercuric ion transport protein
MRTEPNARERALALPGIGGALLAKAACPACWTLVAGGLGSLGLAVDLSTGTLRLLGLVFLTLALGALAWRAPRRRGYGPLIVGVVAAAALWTGEHVVRSETLALSGVSLLVAAAVWNAWPRRTPLVRLERSTRGPVTP